MVTPLSWKPVPLGGVVACKAAQANCRPVTLGRDHSVYARSSRLLTFSVGSPQHSAGSLKSSSPAQVSTFGLARIGLDALQDKATGPASRPKPWADEFAQVSIQHPISTLHAVTACGNTQ